MMRDRPAFFWAALAMLLFLGAMLVPTEWTQAVGSLLDPTANPETTAFSPKVSTADRRLRTGEPLRASTEQLETWRPYLQARRISQLGPMTEPDIQTAVELFKEFRAQQQPNMSPGSREALLRHTIEELLDAVPPLRDTTNADEIRQTLDQLATQIHRSGASGSSQQ
jgi:hypothetical protein